MSFKLVIFYLWCAVALLVLLPLFAVGSVLAMFIYAVLAEIGEFVTGGSNKSAATDAREMARLMCLGN